MSRDLEVVEFKVGDIVIIQEPNEKALDHNCGWVESMDELIGLRGEIVEVMSDGNIFTLKDIDNTGKDFKWYFNASMFEEPSERFEELNKGDIVKVKKLDDLVSKFGFKDGGSAIRTPISFVSSMYQFAGKEFAVDGDRGRSVTLEGCGHWYFDKACLELVKRYVPPTEFKVGETVQFKKWDDMEEEFGLTLLGNINCQCVFTGCMSELCEEYATITKIYGDGMIEVKTFDETLQTFAKSYNLSEEMIKPIDWSKVEFVKAKDFESMVKQFGLADVDTSRMVVNCPCYYTETMAEHFGDTVYQLQGFKEKDVYTELQIDDNWYYITSDMFVPAMYEEEKEEEEVVEETNVISKEDFKGLIGRKVKILSWKHLEEKYGTDFSGDIDSPFGFNLAMQELCGLEFIVEDILIEEDEEIELINKEALGAWSINLSDVEFM